MKYLGLSLLLILILSGHGLTQEPTNTNTAKNYVNVNTPKTPESAAFDRYGVHQVNEFTGAVNVSVPIYTLKSRFLEVPITLSYSATGIKVNQEASWVGLGFDMMVGGRVSVETKGGVDFNGSTWGQGTPHTQATMTQIFNWVGNYGENAVYTPATFTDPPNMPVDPQIFNGFGISEMTQFGTGEPDIFRANFAGNSLAFYVDKISNQLKFLGERSNFQVTYITDVNHNITQWKIIDDDGVTYFFNQTENVKNTFPGSAIVPEITTSAWLLTQILHPSGDNILFTYASYGYSIPAFNMSGFISVPFEGIMSPPSDEIQNIGMQSPYYLTRVESSDIAVDFVLDTRTDLYGPGSRRLKQVKVIDKSNNIVKKTATLHQSYFTATVNSGVQNYLNTLTYQLPSPLSASAYLSSSIYRLKLDSVNVNDSTRQPPFRFYYNSLVVDKYSYSQDNWGYYNGINNTVGGYSFSHLVPLNGQRGIQTLLKLPPAGHGFLTSYIGESRDASLANCQAMILDSVVYPTGGSSKFSFGLHQSTMQATIPITGGGLRVQSIKNYTGTNLAGTTEYGYVNGRYMGTINYFTDASPLSACGEPSNPQWQYNSNGAINYNDVHIGYGQITIVQRDAAGVANGSVVKLFNISTPSSNYSNGLGIDLKAPYYITGENTMNPGNNFTYIEFLDPWNKNFPPTPSSCLEGKLMQEQYLDNAGNPIKTVNHYYRLAGYTNNYFSIKAIQNRNYGFNPPCGIPNNGYNTGGWRPVNLFVSPAKTYSAIIDSTVEKTFQATNAIVQKKTFTYDAKYKVRSESTYNSDNTVTAVSYTRPYDYTSTGINGNTTIIYEMIGKNFNNTVFSTTTRENGVQIDSVFQLYHNPSSNIYVPQNTQIKISNFPMETRQVYNAFDNYGHLLERQKSGGVKENYVWGYDKKFLVAIVSGSDYTTVAGIVDANILNNPASDAVLRTELNKLRTQLPNALVTTYTYDRAYGLTSETDPAGRTKYFDYDGLGRLYMVRDQDNNVLKTICYNYAGQVENCSIWGNQPLSQNFTRANGSCAVDYVGTTGTYTIPANKYYSAISQADANSKAQVDINLNGQNYVNTDPASGATCIPMVKATNTTTMPYTVTFTNTATSAVSSFSANPSASPMQIGQVPTGNYNIQLTPFSTFTGQVTFNSVTQTGPSFTYNNVAVSGPIHFLIEPPPVSNCSISMASGYTSPTNGISKTGNSVTFNLTFVNSSTMLPGSSYWVATISTDCRPLVQRILPAFVSGGRTWTVTIQTNGMMIFQLSSGSSQANSGTTTSTGSQGYNITN